MNTQNSSLPFADEHLGRLAQLIEKLWGHLLPPYESESFVVEPATVPCAAEFPCVEPVLPTPIHACETMDPLRHGRPTDPVDLFGANGFSVGQHPVKLPIGRASVVQGVNEIFAPVVMRESTASHAPDCPWVVRNDGGPLPILNSTNSFSASLPIGRPLSVGDRVA